MPSLFEYMQFSLVTYAASERNRIGIPSGWRQISWQPDGFSGFSAGAYINMHSDEIVISYTGTNDRIADPLNWTAGTGLPVPQIFEAIAFYFSIKAVNPTADITLTGHSLGGGLASLMAVFFDKQATVFDVAPFQAAALSGAVLLEASAAMAAAGQWDSTLAADIASGGLLALSRESNVSHYYLEGEVLSKIRFSTNTLVGNDTPIALGQSTVSMIDKHSMTLLAAVQSSPGLLSVVQRLPNLATDLLDKDLFAVDSRDERNNDLLRRLLRYQFGVPNLVQAAGMMDRFVSDMNQVAQDGGLSMSEQNLTRALSTFAMQMYWDKPLDATKTLFSSITGGIRFNRVDIADTLDAVKGYDLYFKKYIATLPALEQEFMTGKLPEMQDWIIQAGGESMSATAEHRAFMLGGKGDDKLHGSSEGDLLVGGSGDDDLNGLGGNDTLLGGAGDDAMDGAAGDDKLFGYAGDDSLFGAIGTDILTGGDGDDHLDGGDGSDELNGNNGDDEIIGGNGADSLAGGDGFDTYTYRAGDGYDTIIDRDGKILFDGHRLVGGAWNVDKQLYISRDGAYKYQWNGGDLIINGTIRVVNFRNLDLGINLPVPNDPPPPPPSGIRRGDPLILDLTGNGVTTIALAKGAFFDFEGDGFAEQTGWVAPSDGLLALDKNGNGRIDDINELFGEGTKTANGQGAVNGFLALRELDSNGDGKITATD